MGIRRARRGRRGRDITEIASERIRILFERAAGAAGEKDPASSKRYVFLARALSMRYNIHLEPAHRRLFCKKCGSYLVPGRNLRVRLRPGLTVTTCLDCGSVSRKRTAPRATRARGNEPSPPQSPKAAGEESESD